MKHNLKISVSKEPKTGGIVQCRSVTLREKLLTRKNASALPNAVPHGGTPIKEWYGEKPTLKPSALNVGSRSDCTVEKALIVPVPALRMPDARG